MALPSHSPEYIVQHVSWRASCMVDSMIDVEELTELNDIQAPHLASTIGSLDIFAAEILDNVLVWLDLRSLLRFGRVSRLGKALVESLPEYRDLRKHASKALVALTRIELIDFHPVSSLHAALRRENCASCKHFAPFLYLPTCERVCFTCLELNPSWRVITVPTARACFGLGAKDLKHIPQMLSLPGAYGMYHGNHLTRRFKLVSLKQARESGVAKHGTEEAMKTFVAARNAGKTQSSTIRSTIAASRSRLILPPKPVPDDKYWGVATVAFPSLRPNNIVENGLWCFACCHKYEGGRIPCKLDSDTETLLEGRHPCLRRQFREQRARSKSQFLEHVQDCEGAMKLLEQPDFTHPDK